MHGPGDRGNEATMSGGWDFGGDPTTVGGEAVTLVEGSSFCVSDVSGRINSGSPQGVFHMDTRILSSWSLQVDGGEVEPLGAFTRQPHHATFLGRAKPRSEGLESTLLVQRERYVGAGMREDLTIRNASGEPASVTVEIAVDADFADLFAVKEGRTRAQNDREMHISNGVLEIEAVNPGRRRGVRTRSRDALAMPGRLVFQEVIPARGEWHTVIQVLPTLDGKESTPKYPLEESIERSTPSLRLQEWRERAPITWGTSEPVLNILRRTEEDLGSLRIFDPERPDRAAVAAGAPWFMALFGRDSLLTAYMALAMAPRLALGTLQTLAGHQGVREDPRTEEQPGRILHEVRFGAEASLALGGGNVYYGSVDATPLFVLVLGELWRWGLSAEELEDLLPAADRALDWVTKYGDIDGDGFVEYKRMTDRGLRNQGWKDSWDGINFADGRIAEPPIALCEVQGYVYEAYRSRAAIAAAAGDMGTADRWTRAADELKVAFNRAFWLPDRGWFAVGLDRDKRPIDALTSNIGHCLWAGIVDEDKAEQVAGHLLSPDMFSGWGVRTLARGMGAYNPISYHNGSVWPHDNALIAAGLMRYGFVDQSLRVIDAVLAAAECFGGRLPELFTGLERAAYPRPVSYPSSCSPQAWAAAAPLQMMRSLLRFDPALPDGRIYIDPVLSGPVAALNVRGVPLGGARVDLAATATETQIRGLPDGVEIVRRPRPIQD